MLLISDDIMEPTEPPVTTFSFSQENDRELLNRIIVLPLYKQMYKRSLIFIFNKITIYKIR